MDMGTKSPGSQKNNSSSLKTLSELKSNTVPEKNLATKPQIKINKIVNDKELLLMPKNAMLQMITIH
jgi:hypothetical protein